LIEKPEILIEQFIKVSGLTVKIYHEAKKGPHEPNSLPPGMCAVYVFSLTKVYGDIHPAGAHCVLKVGMVGPNSNARFQSHHYDPGRAKSTLAGKILFSPEQWSYLGIIEMCKGRIANWIKQNTDRDHFFLAASDKHVLASLEDFLINQLSPVFEGHSSKNSN
jgi:hypothetical protein